MCDNPLCDTISKVYCAIWGVSRTGPLREYDPLGVHPSLVTNLMLVFLTPDFPESEIAATSFMTLAEVWAKNWAKNWAKCSAHFRASFAVQMTHKSSPKFLPIYHSVSCAEI